jgi:hypothetical protein
MSDSGGDGETESGVFEDPAEAAQRDNAEPLDHLDLDDAESAGAKASEDLHGGQTEGEDVDQPGT